MPEPRIKGVHEVAKTALPVASALVTILGVVVTMLEKREPVSSVSHTTTEVDVDGGTIKTHYIYHHLPFRQHVLGTLRVLIARFIGVAVGLVLAGTLGLAVVGLGPTAVTTSLIALTILAFWLASIQYANQHRQATMKLLNRKGK